MFSDKSGHYDLRHVIAVTEEVINNEKVAVLHMIGGQIMKTMTSVEEVLMEWEDHVLAQKTVAALETAKPTEPPASETKTIE